MDANTNAQVPASIQEENGAAMKSVGEPSIQQPGIETRLLWLRPGCLRSAGSLIAIDQLPPSVSCCSDNIVRSPLHLQDKICNKDTAD